MSCWVVPAIAAELWGVPLSHVMEGIRSGKIPWKTELGFTVVDVAPGEASAAGKAASRKPTFRTIKRAEPVEPQEVEAIEAPEPQPAVLVNDDDMPFDWRQIRRQVQLTRRKPVAA